MTAKPPSLQFLGAVIALLVPCLAVHGTVHPWKAETSHQQNPSSWQDSGTSHTGLVWGQPRHRRHWQPMDQATLTLDTTSAFVTFLV